MIRLLLACLLLFSAVATTSAARPAPQDQYVRLGEARLHLIVHRGREHGPVVLLESGAGLDAREWDAVIADLLPRTDATIVAYDRAGMGQSDPLATPYDVHEEVGRLHKALYSLGLDRDLILVGHSYGGFLIQLYANLYPGDVAGLVYVEANTVTGLGGVEGARKLAETLRDGPKEGRPAFADMRLANALAATTATLERYPPPCGVITRVITQGKADDPALSDGAGRWRAGHAALAAATGGALIYAEKSGHMVPQDQPRLVADAVAAEVEAVARVRKSISFPDPAGNCR